MNVEIGRMMSLTRSPIPMIQLSYTTKHWKIIRICLFAMLSDCKLIHINFNFSSILKSQTKLHRLCSKRMSTYLRSEQKLEIFRMSRRKWCQSPPKQTNGSFKYAVKVDGRTLNDYKKDFVGRYIAWELKLENGNRLYLGKNVSK
ncbi:unnamed protein product [Caenorhabditis brenneri]